MYRCLICVCRCVQVCDGVGRVRVFVLEKRIGYVGVCALARAERHDGMHHFKDQSGFWTQQVRELKINCAGPCKHTQVTREALPASDTSL